jgi:cbb3-type cytochrome oxidase subunit 3
MSFFDEDDEPTRRAPRPRRTAPPGGTHVDPQTVWTRRAVAIGVAVLLLIFLAVVVNACQDSRRKNALRNYNREAAAIISQSDTQVGAVFFETMAQGASQDASELASDVSQLRATADTNLTQAQKLSTPGEVTGAQESLLIALELRRDALQSISEKVTTALGNEGDVANQAIEGITGQMQAFLASDVLIRSRVTPLVRDALKQSDVVAEAAATKGFLPGFSWLQPAFVADQVGTRLVNTGGGRGNQPIAPGLHGDGLTSTTINGVTLQPHPAANHVPLAGDLTVVVEFANQGENTEFDVPVQVTVSGGSGKDITGKQTVDTIAAGDSATVEIPLSSKPVADVYEINVEVKPVPGEKKTDNNKSTYDVLFE